MTQNQTLLADYTASGSEAAFRELVERYIDFVYSAAVRLVDDAPHLAEDVTQIVFTDLARRAGSLGREALLGGWLHRHTCFVAANLMRGERRRLSRERRAAEMNAMPDHSAANLAQIAPVLDDAINHLSSADRTAILLRFFEQRDLRSIGQALGGNEDAARKRVARALEKLHVLLKQRGVTFSAAALGATLAAGTVKAAPSGLSASVAVAAMSGAAAGGGSLTLLKIMAMTKLKIGIAGGIIAAGVVATIIVQQHAQASLQKEQAALAQRDAQLAQLRAQGARLFAAPAPPAANLNTPAELDRLRAEAATLRAQTNDLAALHEQKVQLQKSSAKSNPILTALRTKAEATAKMSFSKQMILAFLMYADKNGQQFPTNFDQALSMIPAKATNSMKTNSDLFELTYHSSTPPTTNKANLIVIREKQAWPTSNGKWGRIYGFADGHVEIANSPNGDFDDWESQHILPPSGQ